MTVGNEAAERRRAELKDNLTAVRRQLELLSAECNRKVPRLLPVTKFHPASDIAILRDLGIDEVGENREQEARAKAEKLPDVQFHMIGQIQSKKANHVARWAACVHSVDSEKLARGLDRGVALAQERGQREKDLPVFIQYSADADSRRGGVRPADVAQLVELVDALPRLRLDGFMVVPPLGSDTSQVFQQVRSVCDEYAEKLGRRLYLSAGMSADLRQAVAAGTDIVRVGTGILGPRPVG